MHDSEIIPRNEMTTYDSFLQEKAILTAIIERIGELVQHLELGPESLNNFMRVKSIITNDVFRVIFVGGFSRGKSTTINALLGGQILPSKLAPATAISTVIKYGKEPKATAHFRDNTTPPESMDIQDVRDYLLIPRDGLVTNSYGSRIRTNLERVEIEYPIPLCENGVEFIDTPGLEENETRQKITLHLLNQADAAIVLLNCQQLITTEEERFIKQELQGRGFDNIFYVINFCDELTTSEDEEDIQYRAITKLGENERIFMLSAREALRGKANDDSEALENSRFLDFERALERFLVRERGVHKLRTSSKMMLDILRELERLIELRLSLLHKDRVEELEFAEAQFNERKTEITAKKKDAIQRIGEIGVTIGDRLCDGFNKKCRQISRSLPEVASELELGTSLIGSLASRANYQKEVAEELEGYMKAELENWGAEEARKIIAPHVARLHRTLDRDVAAILKDIDEINILLNPEFTPSVDVEENAMERLLAVAGSLAFGDVAGAVTGGVLGVKGSLMQIGAFLAGSSVLYALGFLNPVTAVLLSVGTAAVLITGQGGAIQKNMRLQVADQLANHILDLPDQSERKIRELVFTELQRWQLTVDKGVEMLLDNIEQQLLSAKQEIMDDKEAAQRRYEQLSQEITALNAELTQISAAWSEQK